MALALQYKTYSDYLLPLKLHYIAQYKYYY